ncbi:MAG: hypothetical protein K0S47_532 [Herbinix sp.]|jgi:foldase protein PrsA|nr:hypothetical protein [Herbinix sp.]
MKGKRIQLLFTVMILGMLVLSACKSGADKFEMTNYMDNSISTIRRRTGIELKEQSKGVYLTENVMQVMAPDGDVTSIKLLPNAGELTLYEIGIGMKINEVQEKLGERFGEEESKTLNSSDQTITYGYLDGENELYITYGVDSELVTEISYYHLEAAKDESGDVIANENGGELIAMIGDTRVYYNEAMVYIKSVQENYETEYGKEVWDAKIIENGTTFGDSIKEEVLKQITELKVIAKVAQETGIALTEEEMADAKAYAKEHYENLTKEDINRYFITQELLERVYADNILAEKVFEEKTLNVDTEVPDLTAQQITVQDILIYGVNFDSEGNKVDMTSEEKESAYEKVTSLLEQAKETDNFYALAETNSEADTFEYTFGRGEGPSDYSEVFEQAAFSLRTGQVSEIITTDYGWHILYCVTDFNKDATIQVKENIIEQRRNDMFAKEYSEWAANYDVVLNIEAWDAIGFTE